MEKKSAEIDSTGSLSTLRGLSAHDQARPAAAGRGWGLVAHAHCWSGGTKKKNKKNYRTRNAGRRKGRSEGKNDQAGGKGEIEPGIS